MSLVETRERLHLPEDLQNQLHDFRRQVWSIKMTEAVCGAVFSVVTAFLLMYGIDRLWDSPALVRSGLFAIVLVGCALVPIAMHRWIWRNRRLDQLARLLSRRHPHVGDQLLGIIELAEDDDEQKRSRVLCAAAIEQVAKDAHSRDFGDSVPNPRHRLWSVMALVPTVAAIALAVLFPAATGNAWARLLTPWKHTPRYTFAAVTPLPERLVVPHGETFNVKLEIAANSPSRPGQGRVQLGEQEPVQASLRGNEYEFTLPPQIDSARLDIRIGDFIQEVVVEPKLRPELTSIVAKITLPEYLGRPGEETRDVRGGTAALVKGSRAEFSATVSRPLASASVDGQPIAPAGPVVTSPVVAVEEDQRVEFQWRDEYGLSAKEPFGLSIDATDDEAPTLIVEDLPRLRVLLDSEQLTFNVHARDDFGVKQVGIEWQGMESAEVRTPAEGERILSAGGYDRESLELAGTFSAKALGIEPQPIKVRVFAEDYFPGRERVYSAPYTFFVLSPEQHAIWVTEQLSKWHRQSLEVRDRELQLYETNKELREMSQDQLDRPETRQKIEKQASAERANGQRLTRLTGMGDDLVRQAMRNPEIGVGHLEKWAEMLQILKDISANRMPSVSDLLKQAAQAPSQVAKNDTQKAPMAGQIRASDQGKPSESDDDGDKKKPPVPAIVDRESQQQIVKPSEDDEPPEKKKGGSPSLRLPVTTLASMPKKAEACPAGEKVEEAVKEQEDLLAEFEKIADELNRVLANLEGSTLVKRLKAASRLQYTIGGKVGDQTPQAFGNAKSMLNESASKVLGDVAEHEAKASQDVSFIMDDMHAYFERRRMVNFKTVLDEMRQADVIGGLRQIGDDVRKEAGLSVAQCEFWSDTLDRWAEDLVDPASGGT
jgi:hypothetical protein